MNAGPTKIFLIAGEHSGDALGGKLIEALKAQSSRPLELKGVGGEFMGAQGLHSMFPLTDLAVMSPLDVLPRLRHILRRIRESAAAVIDFDPDVPNSPIKLPSACAARPRRSPLSIMSRRACGLGDLGAHGACAVMWTISSAFCPSNPKRIGGSEVPLAAMSATL